MLELRVVIPVHSGHYLYCVGSYRLGKAGMLNRPARPPGSRGRDRDTAPAHGLDRSSCQLLNLFVREGVILTVAGGQRENTNSSVECSLNHISKSLMVNLKVSRIAVSYTHLTLPTS